MINWKCTPEEFALMVAVRDRAIRERLIGDLDSEARNLLMDIHACHCNGCPLQLEAMLTMPLLDFGHDIGGIGRHINRETGKLEDFFVPRSAA